MTCQQASPIAARGHQRGVPRLPEQPGQPAQSGEQPQHSFRQSIHGWGEIVADGAMPSAATVCRSAFADDTQAPGSQAADASKIKAKAHAAKKRSIRRTGGASSHSRPIPASVAICAGRVVPPPHQITPSTNSTAPPIAAERPEGAPAGEFIREMQVAQPVDDSKLSLEKEGCFPGVLKRTPRGLWAVCRGRYRRIGESPHWNIHNRHSGMRIHAAPLGTHENSPHESPRPAPPRHVAVGWRLRPRPPDIPIRRRLQPLSRIAKDASLLTGKGISGQVPPCPSPGAAATQVRQAAGIPSRMIVYSYETFATPLASAVTTQPDDLAGNQPLVAGSHIVVAYEDRGRTYIMDNESWTPKWIHEASPAKMAQQMSGLDYKVQLARVVRDDASLFPSQHRHRRPAPRGEKGATNGAPAVPVPEWAALPNPFGAHWVTLTEQ